MKHFFNYFQIKFTTIYPFYVANGFFKPNLMNIKFKFLTPLLNNSDVVKAIISAQRKGFVEVTVPQHLYYLDKILKLLPLKAYTLFGKFSGTTMESDVDFKKL